MELLSWSIYITTIPKQIADYKELFLIYGLRWRIEIIFKSWKSNLGFGKIHNVSNIQLKVILMARFIMILICTQYLFAPCRIKIKKYFKKNLSLLKVIHYLIRNPDKIIRIIAELAENPGLPGKDMIALARYCSYEKRIKRLNYEQYMEKLFALS